MNIDRASFLMTKQDRQIEQQDLTHKGLNFRTDIFLYGWNLVQDSVYRNIIRVLYFTNQGPQTTYRLRS